jgi:hypothetical protein
MEKQDREMIEKIERQTKCNLTDKEKMICLIAFRFGIVEGYNRCEKIVEKIQ